MSSVKPLTQRMPREELLQFGHQLARSAERELCIDPFF
jgi:hypothetical protein